MLLPPGEYDVYWKLGYDHPAILLASRFNVQFGQLPAINADLGIKLKVPAGTTQPEWWSVVLTGADASRTVEFVGRSFEQPMMIPPGAYDIYWKVESQEAVRVQQGVVVAKGTLTEIDVQPPPSKK